MPDSLDTLLARWRDGDNAAGEQVFNHAYPELRKLAAVQFRYERRGHSLQPTVLVHEVFLKIARGRRVLWQNKAHFYAVFSRQARRVLVDHARRHKAQKRQDSRIEFAPGRGGKNIGPQYENLLTMDRILSELEELTPRAAQVVEWRVFGGMTDDEVAAALDVSPATVRRDWTFARAWLLSRLKE